MGSPSPWAGILTSISGPNGIAGLPPGVQPTGLYFGPGISLTWNGQASQGGIAGRIEANVVAGGNVIDLVTSVQTGIGANGAEVGGAVVLPSSDFPGTTKATLYAVLWADVNGAPTWAASTAYSSTSTPPDIIQDAGQGGQAAAYVCTTSGTSSGSHGPMGNGAGLQDQGGSPCRWRSAQGRLGLYVGGVLGPMLSTGYTLAGVGASANLLELTMDVTSELMGLTSRTLVVAAVAGDASDNMGGTLTKGVCARARLIFS
jgi:hypothetical protein